MAEPPKTKRPSRSKNAPEPDFSPFEDWLIDGPAGEWPDPWESEREFSDQQKRIVAKNARDLGDKEAWLEKVDAFEVGLSALAEAAQEKDVRARYHIRFDRHVFANGLKDFSDYQFPCSISFDGANFGKGNISFDGAAFGKGNISFDGAKFGDGSVWFYGATFGDGDVSFSEATFGKGDVLFDGATFGKGDVWFYRATFGDGSVLFNRATFGDGEVSFDGANFGNGNESVRSSV